MSEELKDLRCKITPLSACYLEAEARARKIDKSDLVREILEHWAMSRHGTAITAQRLLAAEGITWEKQETSGILGVREGSGGYWEAPMRDLP